MRPDEVTESLGIQPSFAEVSYVARYDTGRKEECGLWSYDTANPDFSWSMVLCDALSEGHEKSGL